MRHACVPLFSFPRGLQRHDRGSKTSKTKINPYFKFELGGANSIKKRSTPIKNSNSTPDFKGEVRCGRCVLCARGCDCAILHSSLQEMFFDMIAPKTMLQNGDLLLKFEVWNDSTFSDDVLGQGVMSILEFFENRATKRYGDVAADGACCAHDSIALLTGSGMRLRSRTPRVTGHPRAKCCWNSSSSRATVASSL